MEPGAALKLLPQIEQELRTLLNAMMGTTQIMSRLLLQQTTPAQRAAAPLEEWKAHLDTLQNVHQDCAHLLDELMDYMRLSQGRLHLKRQAVDFAQLIQQTVMIYAAKAKEKGVLFDFTYQSNASPVVYGDAIRIQQILSHLLDNAIKFTHKGRIQVIVSNAGDNRSINVLIRDTGVGITPEKLNQLFVQQSQFTMGYAMKSHAGLGLGLTLVKHFVEQQGGELHVLSDLHEGTEVNFTLPADTHITESVQLLADIKLLLVEQDSGLQPVALQQFLQRGLNCQGMSLEEANYTLAAGDARLLPRIVIIMANYPDYRNAYFARMLKTNRQCQNILLMLALPSTEQYFYEKEQALINGYDAVVPTWQPALMIESIAALWKNRQQKGELGVIVKRSANISNNVLVIEDNKINQKVIQLLLAQLGLNVEIAPTGKKGLEAVDKGDYAAVFVDLGLPDITGLEVIEDIRKREDFKSNWPIIVLTADAALSEGGQYRRKGIDAYLVKPLTIPQLRETLRPYFQFELAM